MAGPDKPIIHGADHAPGGPDPIPGLGEGGGIEFDTHPQDGGYLYVATDDFSDSSIGAGIELVDSGGGGVYISAGEGGIRLYTVDDTGEINLQSRNDLRLKTIDNGGEIALESDGEISLDGETWRLLNLSGNIRLEALSTSGLGLILIGDADAQLLATEGAITLQASGASTSAILLGAGTAINYYMLSTGGVYSGMAYPGHYITLPSGSIFELWTAGGGSPILTVNNTSGTPSYHIKSGASWVADL